MNLSAAERIRKGEKMRVRLMGASAVRKRRGRVFWVVYGPGYVAVQPKFWQMA